ncbi:MAG: SpoIIE family protein phosphatase [Acidobacteriota bacterium]|nr:SpoIIE family protein phosphatase [Acidobacteriota bacterium]
MHPYLHPRSRLTAVFLILLVLWVLLSLTGRFSALTTFVAIAEAALGAILLFRLGRYLTRQSIWRLRNRLVVTYLLIGVMPVVLILSLVVLGGYILAGQIAVFLVSSELDRRTQSLNEPAQILSWSTPESRPRVLNQVAPFLRNHFPRLQMLIHGDSDFRYPEDCTLKAPPNGWRDHSGLVKKDGRFFHWAHVSRNAAEVILLEPASNRLLSDLVPNLGAVRFYDSGAGQPDPNSHPAPVRIPPAQNRFDREVTWLAQVNVADWDHPGRTSSHLIVVTTRPSAVLGAIFGEQFVFGQASLYFFLALAVFSLLLEGGALFAGISLTRTITGAVHNLYQGTERVTGGDFSHRIEVRGNDQLAALSTSFNSMTENLERLFHVEKEKERLESELEIAREVQNQLFPKNVPTLRTMELTGVCKPARMVSGDYYDFLCMDDYRVALAIGDVAGKGISAALLMASIQSIMRTQLSEADGEFCTSAAVALLNRQLYASTSPEKYATFYFGVYDEAHRMLTYTNAGHLPPLLIRDGRSSALEVTGTVVGAFPKIVYEQIALPLCPGDLLVAYTDGIAEPENEYGEEFGVDRLTDIVLRYNRADSPEIIAHVMEAVTLWTGNHEQPDDMTLMLARIT